MAIQREQDYLLNTLFQGPDRRSGNWLSDMRDVIVSLTPNYGGMYISTPAATTISVAGTMVKAAGTTTATNLRGMAMPTDNRLTYTGVPNQHLHIALSYSMTMAGINDNISVAVALNGVVDTASKLTRFVGTGTDQGAAASHTDLMVSTDDFIEIFVTNENATAAVTLEQGYLFAMAMIVS